MCGHEDEAFGDCWRTGGCEVGFEGGAFGFLLGLGFAIVQQSIHMAREQSWSLVIGHWGKCGRWWTTSGFLE